MSTRMPPLLQAFHRSHGSVEAALVAGRGLAAAMGRGGVLVALLVAVAAGGAACDGDSGGGGGLDFGPPPDGSNDPPEDTGAPPDTSSGEPSVELLGVEGVDGAEGVFCASTVTVRARAENVGGRDLRVVIDESFIVDQNPEQGDDPDVYRFEVDGSILVAPGAGDDDVDGGGGATPSLEDGADFQLTVAALEEGADSLPNDTALKDGRTFTLDAAGPDLDLQAPDPEGDPPTLSGTVRVEGTASDGTGVRDVEVRFQGETLTTLGAPSGAGVAEELQLDAEVDLREQPTAVAELVIEAKDVCGLSTSWTQEVKIVRWAWLTRAAKRVPPEEPAIVDTDVVNWTDDDYPDVVLATESGIRVAVNGGEENPATFEEIRTLTDVRTQQVEVLDLDGNGRLDMVTVQNIGEGRSGLAVHRRLEGRAAILRTETHELPLQASSEVRELVVEDFTNDPEGQVREDIILGTSGQAETIILFKRQNPNRDEAFDQCERVSVPTGDASGDVGSGVVVTDATSGDASGADADGGAPPRRGYECPDLFAPPVTSGGGKPVTQIEAVDVTSPDGKPDGYLDLIVGAEGVNKITVFPNRFAEEGILDTAFSQSLGFQVWPEPGATDNNTRHFCLGNFVEQDGDDDPIDVVVGTETSGTWRVLQGRRDGAFEFANATPPEDLPDAPNVYNMSGTTNADIGGLVCRDFNGDGHEDFAIVSSSAQLLQVHLGNGEGRFNQLPESDLLNPANEGMGFVVGEQPQNLRAGDLDQDGKPDLLMDHGSGGFSFMLNRTTEEDGFDLEATRALVSPLGTEGAALGGRLQEFAIGDLNADDQEEVVAFSPTGSFPNSPWLRFYHPLAADYRDWISAPDGTSSKGGVAPTVFVWGAGTWAEGQPSWPAAYDRMPPDLYEKEFHGAVDVKRIHVADLFGADAQGNITEGGDGRPDLVFSGSPGGAPSSHLGVYVNSAPDGFWKVSELTSEQGSMFRPFDGSENMPATQGEDMHFFPEATVQDGSMPTILVGTDAFNVQGCPTTFSPTLRLCKWDDGKKLDPNDDDAETYSFWTCWEPGSCGDDQGRSIGGGITDLAKVDLDAGEASPDRKSGGDVLALSEVTEDMSVSRWQGMDFVWPFDEPSRQGIGNRPNDMAVADIDLDGRLDIAATVENNVHVAFGEDSVTGFEAPGPVDSDPSVQHTGGVQEVVLSDLNDDGFKDVAFTERGDSRLTIYLAAGEDPEEDSFSRQFHGPIRVPLCSQPTQLAAHDFDDDGCENLLALCEQAGAIAMVGNATCDQ